MNDTTKGNGTTNDSADLSELDLRGVGAADPWAAEEVRALAASLDRTNRSTAASFSEAFARSLEAASAPSRAMLEAKAEAEADPEADPEAEAEAEAPQLAVVPDPRPRPFFARARSVRTGSPRDGYIFLTLATYADPKTGECWPSLNTLCADTQYSRRSMLRALTSLERDGHISRQRSTGGRGKATRYHLHLPPTAGHLSLHKVSTSFPQQGHSAPLNRGSESTKQGQRVHQTGASCHPKQGHPVTLNRGILSP